ncbi:MAG TPA: ABC transporter substrate-binding protein [Candidatus Fimousia stercorigallinarum]|nr:ABC transporter substrate-binding protein [Candidatus Fimousia stercorigallinarum]
MTLSIIKKVFESAIFLKIFLSKSLRYQIIFYILLWKPGGMPEMIFEYVLKKNGIDPDTDINMIQNIDFANTAGAFTGGTGDFTVEFEPNATALENEGAGYVVASLGTESGYVPYTTYCAKKSYLEKNSDIIEGFTRAIAKGQQYVNSHTAKEIAKVIAPQFKETSEEDLIKILNRYMEQDTYKENPVFDEDGYDLLQEILDEAGELKEKVPFETLVDNQYAEKALK